MKFPTTLGKIVIKFLEILYEKGKRFKLDEEYQTMFNL